MRPALKAQDANATHRNGHTAAKGHDLNLEPIRLTHESVAPRVSTQQNHMNQIHTNHIHTNHIPTNHIPTNPVPVPTTTTTNLAVPAQACIEEERDSMRTWRARWRQIMRSAVIYFDGIPPQQSEKLRGFLSVLGSTTQPFYDQKVTHVISEQPRSELAAKAREHECKVYTMEKLARFLSSLLGHPLTTALDANQSARLAQMLENDSRLSTPAHNRNDFIPFRGAYLLVTDSQGYHRPLITKEWRTPPAAGEEGDWPQLRRVPAGLSPFSSRFPSARGEKRRAGEHTHVPALPQHPGQVQAQTQVQAQGQAQGQAQAQAQAQATTYTHTRHRTTMADQGTTGMTKREDLRETLISQIPTKDKAQPSNHQHQHQQQQEEEYELDNSPESTKRRLVAPESNKENQITVPAQATNSTRLRDFGEIVASGVPRYSQTSAKSFSARDSVASREMANLRRKMTGTTQVINQRVSATTNTLQPSLTAVADNVSADNNARGRIVPMVETGGVDMNPFAVRAQARPKPISKKPGYCENCLDKYDDLLEHMASRVHQQYASTESKFVGLDKIIQQLQR